MLDVSFFADGEARSFEPSHAELKSIERHDFDGLSFLRLSSALGENLLSLIHEPFELTGLWRQAPQAEAELLHPVRQARRMALAVAGPVERGIVAHWQWQRPGGWL